MKAMSTPGIVYLVIAAALTMAANLMLRAGIDAAGGFAPAGLAQVPRALVTLAREPRFDAGFVCYFLASVVWFRVVATEPLSVAYPVLVALTFTLVTAGAVLLFGEALSLRKFGGLALILAGILLVSFERTAS
jgi:multidrug transporter EmrE-like cation transporter